MKDKTIHTYIQLRVKCIYIYMSIHFVGINNPILRYFIWAMSRRRDRPATQPYHHLIAKPNKTAPPPWPTHMNNRYLRYFWYIWVIFGQMYHKNLQRTLTPTHQWDKSIMQVTLVVEMEPYLTTRGGYKNWLEQRKITEISNIGRRSHINFIKKQLVIEYCKLNSTSETNMICVLFVNKIFAIFLSRGKICIIH